MPKLTINGIEVEFEPGMTVLQAAESAGIEIPVFCYHPKLNVAGNCRMCLVEMEKSPKPVASCAMPAAEGMVIKTNTPYVEKARKGVLEFLLINHPLDCPICDQGGECDLQDITMKYGASTGRYHENKRAVVDKYLGPLIKTTMTRCIHCTRCVRFSTEVAGVQELGATGRGEHMEITTFIEKALSSELSGNMIDICPVGALTSKPYAFQGRPWELTKTDSIDVMDAVGSNIRIDSRGREVMRILPRVNDDVNEDWISDKTRFSYDGLKTQRLDRPYVRVKGKLVEATWDEAFAAIKKVFHKVEPGQMAALVGDMADCEAIYALKKLMEKRGVVNMDCRQDGTCYDMKERGDYLFNTTIAGIEQADACLLIGSYPRWEAPLVNARLRKRYFNEGLKVGVVGSDAPLSYPSAYLGDDPNVLKAILSGKHSFADVLEKAQNPMVIVGQTALQGTDGALVYQYAKALAEKYGMLRDDWNGFNVLHTAAARVGGLDLGFVPQKDGLKTDEILEGCRRGDIQLLYLLAADEIPQDALKKPFIIYQGHHGDVGAQNADIILPGAAYTEKNATYVNTEGRVQRSRLAVFPPGDAREDWKIIRALSDVLEHSLDFDSLEAVRTAMVREYPTFAIIDQVEPAKVSAGSQKLETKFTRQSLAPTLANFYMTDPISRHSVIMARCVKEILERGHPKEGHIIVKGASHG